MLTKYKMDIRYKRMIAAFLGVCLVLGISATAWADNGTQSGTASAPTQQSGSKPCRMGRPNGNDGMNGGFGGGQPGDMPEAPDGERPDDMPEMPDGERPEPPAKPDDDGTEPPEKPEGDESEPPELLEYGEHIDCIPGLSEELLDALLDAGIITEDEYEALLELVPAVDVSEA